MQTRLAGRVERGEVQADPACPLRIIDPKHRRLLMDDITQHQKSSAKCRRALAIERRLGARPYRRWDSLFRHADNIAFLYENSEIPLPPWFVEAYGTRIIPLTLAHEGRMAEYVERFYPLKEYI